MANGRTGQVFIEAFDIGVATTMGGELIELELDGEHVQTYAVRINGLTGPDKYQGLVPISMSEPEDAFQEDIVPQIVISRSSMTPAMERWFPGGRAYMVPAANAKMVPGPGGKRMMPTIVEEKTWARPYEIMYDIHLRARLRAQADLMLRHVGRFYWAYGQVFLKDSEGEERGYMAFADSYDPLSELTDVADRLQGHTISMRVEGELDFDEPRLMPTTPNYVVGTEHR